MIYTTACPAAVLPIEEAPPDLATAFRLWWEGIASDGDVQGLLYGRRGVRFLCGEYLFWLGKEDDRTDVVRTMARSIDLPGRGDGR